MSEAKANPYDVLGVPRDATEADVKLAYRKLCKRWHTDRKGGSHEKMLEIRAAHDVLIDTDRRKQFDETGSVEPLNHLDALAREMLLKAFGAFINDDDEYYDCVPGLKAEFGKHLEHEKNTLQQIEAKLKNIDKRAKRCKRRDQNAEHDLFQMMCDTQRKQLLTLHSKTANTILAIPLAIRMLDEYESSPERIKRDEYISVASWTRASTTSTYGP